MTTLEVDGKTIPIHSVHTLILGSGAAGLNAAVQLHARGIRDMVIVTEGLSMGTSINTGSDKQTYYKLGLYGGDNDSPEALAHSFFDGGSMHGDLALVEASLSARAFLNLANLGVNFPQDAYGQFVGYKTDHDPLQRATSFGPYTSREMCRVLIEEVKRRNIEVHERRVAIKLITIGEGNNKRAGGIIAVNQNMDMNKAYEAYAADNVIFAVGGPGGLYQTSVYPNVHTGAIGLALQEGAAAQSLSESQYGAASIKFRWNVSGTYMQVLPRIISTAADGSSDKQEFLIPSFTSEGKMNSAIFLKGYQWPFDPRKVTGGSSIIDILIYIETAIKGRRVFMDFTHNSSGFSFSELDPEASDYLKNSDALFGTPIERLKKMNPDAITLYSDHGINIVADPLEIAICAQHNNGGLAGTHWWESTNIKHLFPIGEVNGSHGVYRPGGSALNSGQVAGFRVADYIANRYATSTLDSEAFSRQAQNALTALNDFENICSSATQNWEAIRQEFQARMTRTGAHIRRPNEVKQAAEEAWNQYDQLLTEGSITNNTEELVEGLRNIQLCFAHAIYLEAILYQIKSGVGSRGSALVLDPEGVQAHPDLGATWNFAPENEDFRTQVLETFPQAEDHKVKHRWVPRRDLPESKAWFEKAWADYRAGKIYS